MHLWMILQVKLGTSGYKERYYDEKFSTRNHNEREDKRKEVVHGWWFQFKFPSFADFYFSWYISYLICYFPFDL